MQGVAKGIRSRKDGDFYMQKMDASSRYLRAFTWPLISTTEIPSTNDRPP